MVQWSVQFEESVFGDLKQIDTVVRDRIFVKIKWLQNNFDTLHPMPLRQGLHGFFRLRVGDYRVIYRIDWDSHTLDIFAVGHRKNIYTRLPHSA